MQVRAYGIGAGGRRKEDGLLGWSGVPEEGYQCSVLSASGIEYCVSGSGNLGGRFISEYWAGRPTERNWRRGYRTESSEVRLMSNLSGWSGCTVFVGVYGMNQCLFTVHELWSKQGLAPAKHDTRYFNFKSSLPAAASILVMILRQHCGSIEVSCVLETSVASTSMQENIGSRLQVRRVFEDPLHMQP